MAEMPVEHVNLAFKWIGGPSAKLVASLLSSNYATTTLNVKASGLGVNFVGDNSDDSGDANNMINYLPWPEGPAAFATALAQNSTLTSLRLDRNMLGPDGAKRIANALQHNSTLASLNLKRNGLGPKCAKYIAAALNNNQALTELNLKDNQIHDEGLKRIAAALSQNSTLTAVNLSRNRLGAQSLEALVVALATNPGITSICLDQSYTCADRYLGATREATALALQRAAGRHITID